MRSSFINRFLGAMALAVAMVAVPASGQELKIAVVPMPLVPPVTSARLPARRLDTWELRARVD